MSECAVCSSSAPHKCAACKSVSYCSPAHQKEDWKAHKKVCPTLALETREYEKRQALAVRETKIRLAQEAHDAEELLLRITTCLAQNGYHKEVGIMVQLNKAFWWDEQIWDAYKDYSPGPKGWTRLMYASGLGLLGRVQRLLARGARINLGTVSDGTTPLMMASVAGHLEVVRELCKRGANVNAAKTDNGYTSLMWASQKGHLKVVRELCARNANVNAARTTDGLTSLMLSSQKGHLEIVRELCERGANVNATRTTDGLTALMSVSEQGHLDAVRELCKRGANVNAARTTDGWTALMCASRNGHISIAQILLDHGVSKTATSTGEGNAHDYAAGDDAAALRALLKP